MLTLPIKKKWFDMILYGEKKEEYREITPYYIARFENIGLLENLFLTGECAHIRFRNGYHKKAPMIEAIVKLDIGEGRPEWGAEPNKTYYVLNIREIVSFNSDEPDVYFPDCDLITGGKEEKCGDCYRFEVCRKAWENAWKKGR